MKEKEASGNGYDLMEMGGGRVPAGSAEGLHLRARLEQEGEQAGFGPARECALKRFLSSPTGKCAH